ncbi:MAG TPA: hypothetical protein VHM92_08985 [Allosphingosinicella sp.]|nr:hypothetical protein [Allosphingosinicella sp.]
MKFRDQLVIVALAASAVPAAATAQQADKPLGRDKSVGFSITSGVDFSVGSYGGPADTKILVAPLSFRGSTGSLRFSATLPYLRIDSPANIVGGGEQGPIIIDPNGSAPRTVREGLGDLSLAVTYALPKENLAGFEIDLTGRVKLPTASHREGLSTGKTDFGASVDISRTIGTATPFVTLGYRVPGDLAGFDLKNTVSASIGSGFTLGSVAAIASYDYSSATSALSEDSHSLFAALAAPLSKRLTLTGYGIAGLSNGAPDYGVGLLVTAKVF